MKDTPVMEEILGTVLVSKAGRDKGGLLVVVGIEDEHYVLVADGKHRRVASPKRKKTKHVSRLSGLDRNLLVMPPEQWTDGRIRKHLRAVKTALEASGALL